MDDMSALRRLNFKDLLVLDHEDVANYGYREYRANGYRHPRILGYCIECERKGCNTCVRDPEYSLRNVSHGAHTTDFLAALPQTIETTGWHAEPIMFVYESPSLDYGIYETVEYDGVTKRPSKDWYWIHHDQPMRRFPEGFTGGSYGDFVLSAILTFRLSNAYATNLVKCGMNTSDGHKFRGLASFQNPCVQTCIERYLRREVQILEPRLILAIGSAVYNWLSSTRWPGIPVYQLPHPAGRRRGFKNAYFRVLYFWLVALALHDAGVIDRSEAEDLARSFVRDYREP